MSQPFIADNANTNAANVKTGPHTGPHVGSATRHVLRALWHGVPRVFWSYTERTGSADISSFKGLL